MPWHERGAVTSALYANRMLGGSLTIALLNLAQGRLAVQAGLLALVPLLGALVLSRLAPPTLAGEYPQSIAPKHSSRSSLRGPHALTD